MKIVIAGAGGIGFHLAKLLSSAQHDIVIIDTHKDVLEYAQSHLDVQTILRDASSISVKDMNAVKSAAEKRGINFRYVGDAVSIAFDETVRTSDVNDVVAALAEGMGAKATAALQSSDSLAVPGELQRKSAFLTHPVFNAHHTELELQRYIKRLENKDFSLMHAMIPLGSCTMKLNAASTLLPLSWPEWGGLHPFAPVEQTEGYQEVFRQLSDALAKATGFTAVSLQPNSGAQGEYAGLLVIRAYHEARGDQKRTVALIPSSAHGTNPASAVMAGMQVVVVKADAEGHVDVADLKAKAEQNKDTLSCLMVTYPSTHDFPD